VNQKCKDKILKLLENIKRNKTIISLFFLIGINSIIWGLFIPVWQNPDEIAHFCYIQYLVEHKEFPNWIEKNKCSKEVDLAKEILKLNEIAFHPNNKFLFEDYEKEKKELDSIKIYKKTIGESANSASGRPPLYYLTGTIPYIIFRNRNLADRNHAMRFVSTFYLLLTCLVVYKTSRLLKFSKELSLTTVAFVGFHPMMTMLSGSLNPDTLVVFLFSLFSYYALLFFVNESKFNPKHVFIMIIIMLLTTLTKQNSLILYAVFGLFYCYYLYQVFLNKKFAIKRFILELFAILLTCGIQLKIIFGEATNYFVNNSVNPNLTFKEFFINSSYISSYLLHQVYCCFWGCFGWLDIALHKDIFNLIKIFSIVSFLGIILYLVNIKSKIRKTLRVIFFNLLFIIIGIVFMVYLDYRSLKSLGGYVVQGRYYLILISPIVILLGYGWKYFNKKILLGNKSIFCKILIYFVIFFNFLILLFYIYSRYYEI